MGRNELIFLTWVPKALAFSISYVTISNVDYVSVTYTTNPKLHVCA